MKEIFTDLYKKVFGFFQTQEKATHDESKNVAVNRMKLVLMQDRTNLTPFLLEKMRGEMIEVLAKYVEMDKDALELNFEQEGEQMALMLSIPVIRAKDEEEVKAILEAEEAEASEEETESEEEVEEEIELTGEDIEENDEEDVCSCGCEECEECEECSESPDGIDDVEEADCEQRAKRLAEEQDVADPFNASNQAETSEKKSKKRK